MSFHLFPSLPIFSYIPSFLLFNFSSFHFPPLFLPSGRPSFVAMRTVSITEEIHQGEHISTYSSNTTKYNIARVPLCPIINIKQGDSKTCNLLDCSIRISHATVVVVYVFQLVNSQ